jgi:hypothetical protein
MHTQLNRFKHLSTWSWEIGNEGDFRGSSYWHNTADQQPTHPRCAQSLHNSGFTFEQVLKQVKAKYVLGLTATPERRDGHHPIIYMQCGPIRYKLSIVKPMKAPEILLQRTLP